MEKQNTNKESAPVDVPRKRKRFTSRGTRTNATGESPTPPLSLIDLREARQPGEKKKAGKIKPISDKRLKELAIYRKVKWPYLEEHPICEVDDCDKPSTHIHHRKGRDGKLVYDTNYFMAVGNCCHPKRIHETEVEWAKSKGYLLLRSGNGD